MPLRIAFDLDGVLADLEAALLAECGPLFGEEMAARIAATPDDGASSPLQSGGTIAPPPPEGDQVPSIGRLRLTRRQQGRLWRHVAQIEGFWEKLAEIEPGAIERLSQTTTDRRWEIIFLTRRPESVGMTAQVQTQRWLTDKGFQFPSVYVVQGSRGKIAAALGLDFVVDDRPENCLDVVADSTARAILVWRDDEKRLPAAARRLGIGVVNSMAECLDILKQIDSPAEQPTGVFDRVLRLLGLKTETVGS